MCIKYINTNTALFKNVTKNNSDVTGFLEPFDCIIADCIDNVVSIKDFNIVTYINLMGSKNKNVDNILTDGKTLQVCIRLTKCTQNSNECLSIDLDTFEIETKNSKNIIYDACVPYLNFTRITAVDDIKLDIDNPRGSYVIKTLVKTNNSEKYTVQSIYHLEIK